MVLQRRCLWTALLHNLFVLRSEEKEFNKSSLFLPEALLSFSQCKKLLIHFSTFYDWDSLKAVYEVYSKSDIHRHTVLGMQCRWHSAIRSKPRTSNFCSIALLFDISAMEK